MDDSKRPESRADPTHDDLTKSLMAEFLASTRKPIGSSSLFTDPFGPTIQTSNVRRSKVQDSHPARGRSWAIDACLIAFIGAMAATAFFLLA